MERKKRDSKRGRPEGKQEKNERQEERSEKQGRGNIKGNKYTDPHREKRLKTDTDKSRTRSHKGKRTTRDSSIETPQGHSHNRHHHHHKHRESGEGHSHHHSSKRSKEEEGSKEVKSSNRKSARIYDEFKYKMMLDSKGRMTDQQGNVVINPAYSISTLMINEKKEKDKLRELSKMQKINRMPTGNLHPYSQYFDTSLAESDKVRKKKIGGLSFHEKGTFLKKGESMRKKQVVNTLDTEEVQATKVEEEGTEAKVIPCRYIMKKQVKVKPLDPIPELEWWDEWILTPDTKDHYKNSETPITTIRERDMNMKRITSYIQHPVCLKNEYIEKIQSIPLPMLMTTKEREKLSRIKRLEKHKDKQDRIKLGIIEAPPSKVKLSNFMHIMKHEANVDPTKTEKKVREIIKGRQETHEKHNLDRKLTKEQRAEKWKKKLNRDIGEECRSALFRIESLNNPSNRYKIEKNAHQFHFSGLCLMGEETDVPVLLLVEGGQWAIKKYKKLLLRRIDWNRVAEPRISEETGETEEVIMKDVANNRCALVWEGVLRKKMFDNWKLIKVRSENEARRILTDKGVENYWNILSSYTYPEDYQSAKTL